jgi:hypothetical protein
VVARKAMKMDMLYLYTVLAMVGVIAFYWLMWREIRHSDSARAKWLVAHTGRGSLWSFVFAPTVVILSSGWRLLHPIQGRPEWRVWESEVFLVLSSVLLVVAVGRWHRERRIDAR